MTYVMQIINLAIMFQCSIIFKLLYLAGVDSGGIQNEIQDMITMSTDGIYVEKNRKPGLRRSLNTAARHVNVPKSKLGLGRISGQSRISGRLPDIRNNKSVGFPVSG